MTSNSPGQAPAPPRVIKNVCVFCGSYAGNKPVFADVARETGVLLAQQGRRLIYGGGHVGLMGIVADACLAAGGEVTGVIPRSLDEREIAHQGLTDLRIVETMHERKALMAELADGFIALPGGVGTLEEVMEIATWALLGIHSKPVAILNVAGFYDPLIEQLETYVRHGFLSEAQRRLVLTGTAIEPLLQQMSQLQRTAAPKWLEADQT